MRSPKPWPGYAVAVAATAVAALARAAYGPWFGPKSAYLVPFLVPVVLAGWLGGLRCGLFAAALNAAVALYAFTEPALGLVDARPGEAARLGVVAAAGVGLSLISHTLHLHRRADGHAREAIARQEQQALAEKAQVLEAILNSMRDAVLVCDAGGRLLAVNRAFRDLHGLRPDEAPSHLSELPFSVYEPGAGGPLPHDRLPLVRAARGEPTDDLEVELVTARRPHRRAVSVTGRPLRGPDGAAGGVIVLRDVTARRQSDAALRASEERFRHAFEHAPIGVSLAGTDGRFLQANRSLCEMTGYTEVELLATDLQAITHPDDLGKGLDHLRHFRGGAVRAYQAEKRYVRKGGHPLHVHVSVSAVPDARGGPLHFVCHVSDITARKEAEAALRESEARFRTAFDHAPVGMALVAPDGRWQKVNRRLCELVGHTEAELLATDVQGVTHPDDRDADLGMRRQVLAGGIPRYQVEKRYVRKDGRTVDVLLAVSLVRDGAGRPRHFVAQIKDISERRAAQTALLESEAFSRSLMDGSPDCVKVLDPDGRVLYVNARGLCLMQVERVGQVCGREWWSFWPAASRGEVRRAVRTARDGAAAAFEAFCPTAEGAPRWWDVTVSPVRDTAGGPVVRLLSVARDVTARKEAEEAHRAGEERLRMALRGAGAGVWECDLPGWGSYWSPEYRDIYGFAADEEAHVDKWRGRVHPGDLARIEANLTDIAEAGRDAWQQEFRLVIPGHGERWILDSVRVVRAADGRPTRVGGVNIDISERKRAEEQVRASLREKEVLLKEIHHRVKNNLQIVSALLDLQAGHAADPAVAEMFGESRGRVLSMAMIHERLYRSADLARVDFTDYVRRLADDLYRTYKVSADVRLDLDVDIPPLPLDIAIPCGLLLNELISNCLKHAFKGADRGCVRVTFRRGHDGANVLAVSDDGGGLPDGFDIHSTPSFGMQLVTTLADQLDGAIAADAGPGATFRLVFPHKPHAP